MKALSILSAAALSATLAGCLLAGEPKEEKVALDATPAAVQAAIKKAVAAGTLGDVVKESDEGKTVYEAEFKTDKSNHTVKVSESGEVLEEETEVDAKALPAAVTAAVMAKHPGAEIEEACLVTAGGKTYYELGVEVGEHDHEIKVDATGKIIDDKVEEDEKDEKGEEHHGKDHDKD